MRSALRVVLPWIFAAMCCAVARVDSAQGTAAPGVTTCAVDALHKIPLNETCGTVPSSATLPAEPVVLHAMSGEAERMQILLTLPAGADSVVVTAGAAGFSPGGGVDVSVRYVGYVYCHTSTRYDGSGGGWRADPLMPIPSQGVALAAGANLALWVTARAAAGAAAGWRNGSVAVTNAVDGSTLATVPVSVEVWPVALPPLNATDSFATLFSFQYSGDTISRFYGGGALTTPMKHAWLDYLAALRFPGDALYLSEPRSVDDYEYFASQGVRWMNLLDVSSLPLDGDSAAAAVDASGGAAQGGGLRGACANYSDTYVANMIALLEPTVAALTARGLLDRAYVYGFDENPPSCEPQVRKLFGAVKAKWPSLRTVAVLNWPDMPPDLPLDVWVLSYTQYDAAAAAKWRAAGKQQFFYHCIVVRGARARAAHTPLLATRAVCSRVRAAAKRQRPPEHLHRAAGHRGAAAVLARLRDADARVAVLRGRPVRVLLPRGAVVEQLHDGGRLDVPDAAAARRALRRRPRPAPHQLRRRQLDMGATHGHLRERRRHVRLPWP